MSGPRLGDEICTEVLNANGWIRDIIIEGEKRRRTWHPGIVGEGSRAKRNVTSIACSSFRLSHYCTHPTAASCRGSAETSTN